MTARYGPFAALRNAALAGCLIFTLAAAGLPLPSWEGAGGRGTATRIAETHPSPNPLPQGAGASAPVRLLILGDSLTAGYGLPQSEGFQAQLAARLHADRRDVALVDGAVSGDTSADGLARLDWTIGDGVDAALVELGANDGLRGLDPARMQANLSAILDDLSRRHVTVLLSGMYAPPNLGADYERQFRTVFDALGRRPGVLYDPFFLAGIARVRALTQPDGLHPNAEGVRREVARIAPLVERLLDGVHR